MPAAAPRAGRRSARSSARRTRSRAWWTPARTRGRVPSPRGRATRAPPRGTPRARSRRRAARARGSRTRRGTSPRSTARRAPSGAARRRGPRPRRAGGAPRRCATCARRSGCGHRRRAMAGGAGYDGSQIISLWTRRISISSRWPSVTSRPVRAPFISIIVLSAVVVPCTTISRSAQNCVSATPKRSASWPSPVMTPRDWSSSVVGVLSRTTSPSSVTQMRSVKVPPTSTPTR